ncbi:hypothetical protein [Phytopseudomonas punonensis]|uniref:hypothetical protein n=1 Tax=Phytopseudomonas punonensis TaxID=1220495 RepID=UPI001114C43E|nr:hypothetical protein [Pseudomonas punonensis]
MSRKAGAIQSFLIDDKDSKKRLLGKSSPLSSFSAKIDLACLLGMCSRDIAKDLHTIREIRNEFAHNIMARDKTKLSFNSGNIKDKCMYLKCVAHEKPKEPRVAFVRACAILNADFSIHRFFGQKVSDGGQVFAKIEKQK